MSNKLRGSALTVYRRTPKLALDAARSLHLILPGE